MYTLITRNKETTKFDPLFLAVATGYSEKLLTFTTRDEYLLWVKQWKEDYKIVVASRKGTLLSNEEVLRLKQIEARYILDTGVKPWFVYSLYLVWYMLVMRKASKIRAGIQRSLKLT